MINVGLTYGGKQYKKLLSSDVGVKPIAVPLLTTGYSEVMFTAFCRDMYVQVDAAGFTPGDSIAVTVEGSLDNAGWDNLSATDAVTAITENGTTLMYFRDACPGYVRVRVDPTLVSGSTAAAITLKAFFAMAS